MKDPEADRLLPPRALRPFLGTGPGTRRTVLVDPARGVYARLRRSSSDYKIRPLVQGEKLLGFLVCSASSEVKPYWAHQLATVHGAIPATDDPLILAQIARMKKQAKEDTTAATPQTPVTHWPKNEHFWHADIDMWVFGVTLTWKIYT